MRLLVNNTPRLICGVLVSSCTFCKFNDYSVSNNNRLCGFPPFYADDDDEAFDQIIAGEFEYPSPYWDNISKGAKDLINHLLVVNPTNLYTASQAMQHQWIKAIIFNWNALNVTRKIVRMCIYRQLLNSLRN